MTELFQRALDGWRTTRSPRYAAIVEAIGLARAAPERPVVGAGKRKAEHAAWLALEAAGDPDDVPRLLAALRGQPSPIAAQHIARLAQRDDPRVVTGMLDLLERPPYTGGTTRKFWQAVIAALAGSRDPRAKAGMASLAKRYYAINRTYIGDWIAGLLARSAAAMAGEVALDDDPSALDALEREVFGDAPPPLPPAPPDTRVLDDLFAQIVADPDDDAARLVYADALTERGKHLRGELIVLQIERARGRATLDQADRECAMNRSDLLDEMALPLSGACEAVTFERGFPVAAYLLPKGLAQVADAPAWGTIRALDGIERAPLKPLLSMFASGRLANVVEAYDVSVARFAKLAAHVAPWTTIELDTDGLPDDALTRMPALRKLVIRAVQPVSPALLAGAPALDSLVLWGQTTELTPAMLAPLPALRHLAIRNGGVPPHPDLAARAFPITSLKLYGTVPEPWLAALPHVRALTLWDDVMLRPGRFRWDFLTEMLSRPRLTTLTLQSRRITARFERSGDGWTLVLPCANRWYGFYRDLHDCAPHYAAAGVTRVILEPTEPRHYSAPFADMTSISLDQIAQAWAPIPVEPRDVLRWPDRAPDEGYTYSRQRRCPVR